MRFRVGLTGGMVRRLEGVGRWATSNQTPLYILTAVLVAFSAVGALMVMRA